MQIIVHQKEGNIAKERGKEAPGDKEKTRKNC
jgi:hypothetical protein